MEDLTPTLGLGKNLYVQDLRARDAVCTSFLVRQKGLMVNRNGQAYLALQLADRTGTIDTRVWENAESLAGRFQEGDVVAVHGRTHVFQNRLQLVVDQIARVEASEVELGHYLPGGDRDLSALYAELVTVFEGLPNIWVRQLALALLNDPEIARRYRECPAAKTIHHAFLGGLLVHSLQLVKLADAVLPFYPALDRDLVLFGCAFHDFGKIFELSWEGGFQYTDEGRLVGHITIGVQILDRKIREIPEFPSQLEWQLKHLILSHHGKLEYGSPKKPHTLEAELVHHLDHMDSRLESIEGMIRSEASTQRWTAVHKAYDQSYYRPDSLMPQQS